MGFQPLIRSRRGLVAAVSAAATILLAAGVAGAMRTPAAPAAAGLTDMNGRPVQLDPGDLPTPPLLKMMHATSHTGMRLIIDSVRLNVALGALDAAGGQITPPRFTLAYLVRNIGVSPRHAESGTVYVVMHSLRDGGVGPGNFLINVDAGTSRVSVGAQVRVGDDMYAVTGWSAVKKTDVPMDSSLWEDVPGRLVIFTCLQVPAQTESVDNLVITARLVAAGR